MGKKLGISYAAITTTPHDTNNPRVLCSSTVTIAISSSRLIMKMIVSSWTEEDVGSWAPGNCPHVGTRHGGISSVVAV